MTRHIDENLYIYSHIFTYAILYNTINRQGTQSDNLTKRYFDDLDVVVVGEGDSEGL